MRRSLRLPGWAVLPTMLLITVVAAVQDKRTTATLSSFDLFPVDPVCGCIETHSETPTLKSSEVQLGTKVFQLFSDKKLGRELFRAEVGSIDAGEEVKFWNYGIALEGDFNDDGKPDYSWYGGDDTSSSMYVFLSSKAGHRKLDVHKTLEAEWARRWRTTVPDLAAADHDYHVVAVSLVGRQGRLTLQATVAREGHASRYMRIPDAQFLFAR